MRDPGRDSAPPPRGLPGTPEKFLDAFTVLLGTVKLKMEFGNVAQSQPIRQLAPDETPGIAQASHGYAAFVFTTFNLNVDPCSLASGAKHHFSGFADLGGAATGRVVLASC